MRKQPTHQPSPFDRLISNRLARVAGTTVIFGALWLVASYLFYRRFPANYLQPNFYAEDGTVFAKNILNYGFWQSLLTTFNGYYIWGLYILEGIAFILN